MSNGSTDDPTFLRTHGIQHRMRCTGGVAHNIKEAFVTVEQLLDAVESETPLTDVDGIGPKTAKHIEEWYENREERERSAKRTTVERTSDTAASIHFHVEWWDALGTDPPTDDTEEPEPEGDDR